MQNPNWTRAAETAAAIAAAWNAAPEPGGGPGGAIALFDVAGVRSVAAGGFASLAHRVPFTGDTPTRLASVSKHFMAATLLGEAIDLDAPLGTLLPGLPPAFQPVTLGRALDMTGGLPDMMEVLWQQGTPFTAGLSAADIDAVLRRLPGLCAPPGTEVAYSNTGWRLAQSVIPAQRGASYADALHRRLLAPLDLAVAFPEDETEPVDNLATGYWRDGGAGGSGQAWRSGQVWRSGRYGLHFSASGGLACSAATLARWGGLLMGGGGPLAGLLERLAAPRRLADGSESVYRLGLCRTTLGATALVGHGGSLPGYKNHFLLAPDLGVGVAYLSNREDDAVAPTLAVMAALVGEALPKPAASLPDGLFAAATGPYWAECRDGSIEFMGSGERVAETPDGGFRSVLSYLDMRFRQAPDGALEGRFGGLGHRLLPVPPGGRLDAGMVGSWREPTSGAALLVRADGTARFPWAGGVGRETTLVPLPGGRALAALTHDMWRHRPCLTLEADGALRVQSHRARVLRFTRQ